MKPLLMSLLVLTYALGAYAGELDNEINSFQVHLVNKKTGKVRRVTQQKSVLLTENSVEPQPEISADVEKQNSTSYFEAPRYRRKNSDAFFKKISAVVAYTFSTFDGADNVVISPQGMGKAINNGFSMSASADFNVFGHPNLLLEGGLSYLSFGSYTGIPFYGNPQYDLLQLSYVGVNLNAKWLFNGQNDSSLFIKAGATPLFLTGQNYSNLNSMYLNATRFGTISSFDVALNLGVGYSYKVNSDLSVVLDVSGYQGILPVMSFNVYNAGITTGIGAAYSL